MTSTDRQPRSSDLPERLAALGAGLRALDTGTSLRDELDAAEALMLVDRADRDEVYQTVRIALRVPRRCWGIFDRLFGRFWGGEAPGLPPPPPPRREQAHPAPPRGSVPRWDTEARQLVYQEDARGVAGAPGRVEPGYTAAALLRRKPFDQVAPADQAAMERLLERLAARLRPRPGRRLVPTRGRGRPDLRTSYRRALATGGELLTLSRRARALVSPRIVFLCDTSGSMDSFTRFLVTFALSVRRAIPRAEVFAFNTELVHLSPVLVPGRIDRALDRLALAVPDWSGGTRIGESLLAFVERYLTRFVDATTAVVILSDGLDRGDPARLALAAEQIRRRARRLIWLNPLLGDPRYQPLQAGMQAALPFVDHFAAAHNLESLERLLPHLD
jgi:uncharacterized protein